MLYRTDHTGTMASSENFDASSMVVVPATQEVDLCEIVSIADTSEDSTTVTAEAAKQTTTAEATKQTATIQIQVTEPVGSVQSMSVDQGVPVVQATVAQEAKKTEADAEMSSLSLPKAVPLMNLFAGKLAGDVAPSCKAVLLPKGGAGGALQDIPLVAGGAGGALQDIPLVAGGAGGGTKAVPLPVGGAGASAASMSTWQKILGKAPGTGIVSHTVEVHLRSNHQVYDNFIDRVNSSDITYLVLTQEGFTQMLADKSHFICRTDLEKLVFYPTCCSYFAWDKPSPCVTEAVDFACHTLTNGSTVIAADFASSVAVLVLNKLYNSTGKSPINLQKGYSGYAQFSFHREVLAGITLSFKFLALASDTESLNVSLAAGTVVPAFSRGMDCDTDPSIQIGGVFTRLPAHMDSYRSSQKSVTTYVDYGDVVYTGEPLVNVCVLPDGRWASEGSPHYDIFKSEEKALVGFPAVVKFSIGKGHLVVCGLHLVNFTNPSMTDPSRIGSAAASCGFADVSRRVTEMMTQGVGRSAYQELSSKTLYSTPNSSPPMLVG